MLLVLPEQSLPGETGLEAGPERLAAQPLKSLLGPTAQTLHPHRPIGRRITLQRSDERFQPLLALMLYDQCI